MKAPENFSEIEALDAADPLAPCRQRFALPDGVIYLDGNSLGPLPASAPARMQAVMSGEWGHDLIQSWNAHDWVDMPKVAGARIARLIGAREDEVIACDSTSLNLYKLASAALRHQKGRRRIVTEKGNFPADRYMLEGLKRADPRIEIIYAEEDGIINALDTDTALVALTHVNYRTSRMHDLAHLTRAAHEAGALILWDLAHSAGAVPVGLNEARADLAVGCGYKFLNGGPGAPAFLYVARRLQGKLLSPLSGWFGHENPFAFADEFAPAPGIERHLAGTPPILSLTALIEGVKTFDGVSITDLREKSLRMGELFCALAETRLKNFGVGLACPARAEERGSQVTFSHAQGYGVMQALIERGIIGDFRPPHIMRFGLAPLYNSYADIWRTVEALGDILGNEIYKEPRFQKHKRVP